MRILAVILAVIMIFPILFMVSGSFKDQSGVLSFPPQLVPKNPTLKNYSVIFGYPVLKWMVNTVAVVSLGVFLSVLITALAGWILANTSGNDFLTKVLRFGFSMAILIPGAMLFIPRLIVCRFLGILNTPLGAVFPGLLAPVSVLLFEQYCRSIPRSLYDAARVDGCTGLQALTRVYFPLLAPGLAVISIFSAVGFLGDFAWQMLAYRQHTLISGMWFVSNDFGGGNPVMINPLGIRMAGGVLASLPMVLIFIFCSRYFLGGLDGYGK